MNFISLLKQLMDGFGNTLLIFFLTLLFSLPLGLLVCFGRMSKWAPLHKLAADDARIAAARPAIRFFLRLGNAILNFKPIRVIVTFFISILRGTPLMLQIIMVFFGPYYLFHISLSAGYRVTAVIIAFSVNYAAYFAEIFRAGIESIPAGQREASEVLGYTKNQTFMKIILPQMVKRVVPPVTNEVITLVKDTSLASIISYIEMFKVAEEVASAQTTVVPLFVAGLFYYIFNAVVAWAMAKMEKSLAYYS